MGYYRRIHHYGSLALLPALLVLLGLQSWALWPSRWPVVKAVPSLVTIQLKALPPLGTTLAQSLPAATTNQTAAVPKSTPAKPKTTAAAMPARAASEIASSSDCPAENNLAQAGSAILCLTNFARRFHQLGLVGPNAVLNQAAAKKAADIVSCNDFSHTACGHSSNYWLTSLNYPGHCSGENIAEGQTTPLAVFTAWMNSAGHRANILNPNYFDLGIVEVSGAQGPVWVMELGGC